LREPSHKYFSNIEIEQLIRSGRRELADADPEAFKVFLLATFVGLRRREIDLLEWTAFDWQRNYLRIRQTAYFTAKTDDSEAELPLDPELIHLLRGYSARQPGLLSSRLVGLLSTTQCISITGVTRSSKG
jgi:integrase